MHCKSAHQKAGMFFVDVLGVVEGGRPKSKQAITMNRLLVQTGRHLTSAAPRSVITNLAFPSRRCEMFAEIFNKCKAMF